MQSPRCRMKREALLVLIACLLAVAIPALAQSPASYDLSRYVVAGGGGRLAGASYILWGTAGQPAAGLSGGDGYTISSGFWGARTHTIVYQIYLPLVQRNF